MGKRRGRGGSKQQEGGSKQREGGQWKDGEGKGGSGVYPLTLDGENSNS